MPRRAFVYSGFILVCFAVAALGSLATSAGLASWYPTLTKPSFNPPNWLFGPVWTVLYVMIAVAGARLVLSSAGDKGPVLAAYGTQLALNCAWSWVFFYAQRPGLAVIVIAALWLSIVATIVLAWPKDRVASWLMMPYLAWVSFASLLNIAIWRLNS
ncbi:tryptophan-rich sensory protein [Phreatobacter aquaticus]|uniref:Tryptophan-rich sensory protein n=2 Tax=Phreatobacter aquaticus TaxID=2570229 RepID=A0A4D7QSA2_9HYPH|nr:tryptophan-rich sensory protein [Phreatobacter aquaticus]